MFQGGSTLPATYFPQRRASLRPWYGLESVPRNLAGDNVDMPSHLGNDVTVTLRQQETSGNILNGMNHVATSCAITVHGQHDNASRTKALEAECAHYKSENGRLRRQAKQLELSKNHYHQMVLELQRRANEWKRMEINGKDSGLNLAPSSHPLIDAPSMGGIGKPSLPWPVGAPFMGGIGKPILPWPVGAPYMRGIRKPSLPWLVEAPSMGGIRKPSFPCKVGAPLKTASTEVHESESNAPRRHPTRDRGWHPIKVMERHEVANARLDSTLNIALHTPKEEMAPKPFPSKGFVSSATQLAGPSADAATSRQPGSLLTGDVAADAIKCAEDVKTSDANGAASQNHPNELEKSDNKMRPSSDLSVLPDVNKEKGTGMDVQDAALLLVATFKDLVQAPLTSKFTRSDAAGEMGEIYPPANCQAAEEDITVIERPKSTSSISSLASRVIGRTENKKGAEAFEVTGVSTHSMICSYCSEIPCRKALVALCKLCPRRFCLKCFRDDIHGSNTYTGTLGSRTRSLLRGQQGDIFVEWCPWCIQNRDDAFSSPPNGVSWMKHLLQELLKHDLSHCFREPVDVGKHPGYLQRVGRDSMMDLGTMMSKVKAEKYSSRRGRGQFIEDLRKMWKNCRKFAGCDDLGKPTEGDDLPGIVRCALILEAMSTKFLLKHSSGDHVEWHPSAWDYHNSIKLREAEEKRLSRVERKKITSERKLIISRVGKGLKRECHDGLGLCPSTNKRLRLEAVGPSNDGGKGGSCFLRVEHQALHRENRDLIGVSKSNSGHASGVQQQADMWQPLKDLSLAAYSFSRKEKIEHGNNVSLKIRRGPQ